MLDQKIKNRFWSKVTVKGQDDCWEWQASKTKFGHGVFSIKHKWIGAHVVSFIIDKGYRPILPKMVMHDCENPGCVNPKHLVEGTARENGNYPGCIAKMSENAKNRKLGQVWGTQHPRWGMKHSKESRAKISEAAKKRGGWHKGLKRSQATKDKLSLIFRGEGSPKAKLTEKQVIEIYLADGKYVRIAERYGIDPSNVSNIKRQKIWTHVTKNL